MDPDRAKSLRDFINLPPIAGLPDFKVTVHSDPVFADSSSQLSMPDHQLSFTDPILLLDHVETSAAGAAAQRVRKSKSSASPKNTQVNGEGKKRRQVKNACVNCQKANKKCTEGRPCERCVKFKLEDTCRDSLRKERKKGVKRGPYKRARSPSPLEASKKKRVDSIQTTNLHAIHDQSPHHQTDDLTTIPLLHILDSNIDPALLPPLYGMPDRDTCASSSKDECEDGDSSGDRERRDSGNASSLASLADAALCS
ncbi:putative transcriptional regulatory protein [Neolecta irregularis DAH-3]|uniref:Putative transcriptional regulatory protein n=1 Tax=Neolecta irregularis (strain DAH-3) TaxID=1198029 RepID=A0A1U7LLU7_NEOID|nr:putative transcriptional regulatory protein [Neolecta irregularis DAH-3]|eukprot:OLL23608.1 putative transcriptional regulatory protein [Neolecta irregularis DAH-3]